MEGVGRTPGPQEALGFEPGSLRLWLVEPLGVGLTPGPGSQHWSCCPVISDSPVLLCSQRGHRWLSHRSRGWLRLSL